MPTYGFSKNGFETKPYSVLLQELFELWAISFGIVDTEPDGALGQIAISLSLAEAQRWEQMQESFLNSDPRTAAGEHLRSLLSLVGITKKLATKATATIYVGGTIGTVIPEGAQVIQSTTKQKFDIKEAVTISANNLNKFNFKITTGFVAGDIIGFTINGFAVNHTVVNGDTIDTIYDDLIAIVLGNPVVADISSAYLSDDDSEMIVDSTIPYRSFVIESLIGGTITVAYSRTYCEAVNSGIIVVPKNSITVKGTTISGWSYVLNPISGSSGSDEETDDQLRKRWIKATQIGSNATAYAIESKIWENIRGVSNVLVFTNRTDVVDVWGNPAHSVTITVEGGDEDEIATQIANSVPVGVNFGGEISKSVTIDQSPQIVKFSRTKTLFGWIKVVIKAKNAEDIYPTNAEELIRNACFSEAVRMVNLGADVIAQRFIGAIYNAVSGLEEIEVTVSVTGQNTGIDPNVKNGEPWDYDPDTYSSGYVKKVVVAPTDKVEWRDAYNPQRILIIDEVV